MEIIFLIVILIVFLGLARGHVGFNDPKIQKKRPPQPTPRSTPHRRPSIIASVRFDQQTAKPPTIKSDLVGFARIVDGDTIVIQKTQIRLFGIDAPELNHPFGQKAKWALVSLCKGQKVRARISSEDAYGRTVARCYLPDNRDLSAEMVKIGLAIDWPKFSGGRYTHMELPNIRKKLWLADARQKGHMHVWKRFETQQNSRS